MASSSRVGPRPSPFWPEDAVFAHPFWLRLCRVRVYLRRIPAPCAHLFGRLGRATEFLWDSLMIQAHDGSQYLMPLLTDEPPMAVRHLHDQAPHVQPLQHAADRMALAT